MGYDSPLLWCSAIQYDLIQHNAIQCDMMENNMMLCNLIRTNHKLTTKVPHTLRAKSLRPLSHLLLQCSNSVHISFMLLSSRVSQRVSLLSHHVTTLGEYFSLSCRLCTLQQHAIFCKLRASLKSKVLPNIWFVASGQNVSLFILHVNLSLAQTHLQLMQHIAQRPDEDWPVGMRETTWETI